MRRKDVIDTLINILAQENTVEATEVLDEAAFALANCARDCIKNTKTNKCFFLLCSFDKGVD